MAPKDIARSYPKRGLTADVGFRSEPKFCGDGAAEFATGESAAGTYTNTLNSTLSMCCWVKVYNVSQTYFMDLGANSSGGQISISYHNGTGAGQNKRPYIWNGSVVIYATQEMEINEWHHLAVTSAPGAGNIKIYLDGVDVTPSHSTSVNITTNNIYLGRWLAAGGSLDGKIANAALFRTTLTQEQVRECMRASSFSQFDAISTLEAFYPLDANFNDSTSGGHDLTATGSPSFTVDRPQLPRGLDLARGAAQARVYTGRAVEFDGSADHMEAAVYSNASDYFSVSVWVKPDAIGANRNIVASGDTGDNAFLILLQYTGPVYFYGNDTTGDYAIIHQTTLEAGRWYHLAMVVDQSDAANNTIKAYVDGIENTTSKGYAGWIGNASALEIGARNSVTFFDGAIAGVKVFNSELTAAQVRELYHNPEQVLPTGVSASNLRRYYPLSDYNDTGGTGGRYFQDMGADGEPAEDQGSCTMAFAQPVPCPQLGLQQSATRLRFPGGSTSHNAVATTAALGTNASVSCWFQAESTPSTGVLWAIGNATGTGFLEAFINSSDQLQIFGQNSFFVATITDSDWHHLVVTTDSGSPPYRVFLDNSEVSLSGTDTARNLTNGTFEIGNQDTAASPFVFQGILNDVACWNTELGDSDVAALYNSGVMGMDVSTVQSANLKGWWKCDDLTTFKDYSGNSANATVSGIFAAASFPENASGSTIVGDFSMKRKGVSVLNIPASTINEQAIIPANQDVYPSFANGGSLSLFFRLEKLGTTSTIFINSGYGTTHQRFAVYAVSSNKIQFELGDGVSARANPQTTGTISDSDWHHFAMTVDYGGGATTTIKLFIDGVLDSTSTATTLAGVPNASALEILNRGSGNEGKGPLACFKAYQVTLSENEIKQIYNADYRLIKGLNNE